jgi:hypothetical protein
MRPAKSGHSMSKKKPKPLFDVPADVDEAPKAGWVYRSGTASKEEAPAEPRRIEPAPAAKAKSRTDSDTYRVMSAGAEAIGHSFAAVGKLILLGTRVIVLPVRVAERLMLGR